MMTRSTVAAGQAKTPADMVGSSGGLRNSSGSDHRIGPEVVSHRQPPTDQTPRCAPSDRNIIPIGSYEAVPSRCRIILPPLLTALLAVLNLPQKGWSGYGVKSLRWFPRGASRLASCGVQL
jgi:hypothetical protein